MSETSDPNRQPHWWLDNVVSDPQSTGNFQPVPPVGEAEKVTALGDIPDDEPDEPPYDPYAEPVTEEIPIVSLDDANDGPGATLSHWRFVGKVALSTALFITGIVVTVALDVITTRLWHTPVVVAILIPVALVTFGTWQYARSLRRIDQEWSDATAGHLDDEVSHNRIPHISMFLHSIVIQTGIWIVSFIAISLLFSFMHVAWYWDLLAQATVTAVNAYLVTRTYVNWTRTRRIVGSEGITIIRPDLFWLRLRGTPRQDILYSTLVEYERQRSKLIEKFAYRTRGTVMLQTQKPESKDGKQSSTIIISNVSDINGFMKAIAASRKKSY